MSTDSTALAYPDDDSAEDFALCVAGLADVRAGRRLAEVRIGTGPLTNPVPVRVLGYGAAVARTLLTDLPRELSRPEIQLHLFSSAPKSMRATPTETTVRALVSLGTALRMAGVDAPTVLEIAAAEIEVPTRLEIEMYEQLFDWVEARAGSHGAEGAGRFRYAVEHAADSMFGDLPSDGRDPPFRVTVGGVTEGRFFRVRCCIRRAALSAGLPVAPCAAFILKALRRPWYQPTALEPSLEMLGLGVAPVLQAMDAASNPARGGNAGLKSEARSVSKLVAHPLIDDLVAASLCSRRALELANKLDLQIGPRLAAAIGG